MEELNITVTKMTADALRKAAEEAHMPIGEVVDRYALNAAPDAPDNALILILEHYFVCVSRLSEEDRARVFGNICGLFLSSIPPEELDDFVSHVKSTRDQEKPAMELTTEERDELRKAVNDMVQSVKSEYLRTVFYSLLRG